MKVWGSVTCPAPVPPPPAAPIGNRAGVQGWDDEAVIVKYCPWCDYHSLSLAAVLDHKRAEHDFLEGSAPPMDSRFTIELPPEGTFTLD